MTDEQLQSRTNHPIGFGGGLLLFMLLITVVPFATVGLFKSGNELAAGAVVAAVLVFLWWL